MSSEVSTPAPVLLAEGSNDPLTLALRNGTDTESVRIWPAFAPEGTSAQDCSFASDNESVVTVDHDGNLAAVSSGTATVTATHISSGKTADCKVTVIRGIDSIQVSRNQLVLDSKASGNITLTVEPSDAEEEIEYLSSDDTVATVQLIKGQYKITPKTASGQAVITWRAKNNPAVAASCEVLVYTPASAFDLNQSDKEMTIFAGMTKHWTLRINPRITSPGHISYSCVNPGDLQVISCDMFGNYTGLNPGKATLTATYNGHTKNGVANKLTVKVEPEIPVAVTGWERNRQGELCARIINNCLYSTITGIWYDVEYYGYNRGDPTVRSKVITIPHPELAQIRSLSLQPGVSEVFPVDELDAYRIVIRITRLRFDNGMIYELPQGSDNASEWYFY